MFVGLSLLSGSSGLLVLGGFWVFLVAFRCLLRFSAPRTPHRTRTAPRTPRRTRSAPRTPHRTRCPNKDDNSGLAPGRGVSGWLARGVNRSGYFGGRLQTYRTGRRASLCQVRLCRYATDRAQTRTMHLGGGAWDLLGCCGVVGARSDVRLVRSDRVWCVFAFNPPKSRENVVRSS